MTQSTARVRISRSVLAAAVAATGGVVFSAASEAHAAPVPVPIITRYAGVAGVDGDPVTGSALSTNFQFPWALALDRTGNLYVGDCGDTVSKITPAGVLTVLAGTGTDGAPTPGPASASKLECGTGLAVDAAGNVYNGDDSNHVIEKITPAGVLSIYAGTGAEGTPVPGSALASPLGDPDGLAIDAAGNLFVGDSHDGGVVYKITPAGQLVVVAGNGTYGLPVPGPALASPLGTYSRSYGRSPIAVAVAGDGTLYIADYSNDMIEKVTPAGILSVVAGTGTSGAPTPGPAIASQLDDPEGVSLDAAGNLYIADSGNNIVEKVTPAGVLSIVTGTGTETAPLYGSPAATSPIQYDESAIVSPAGVIYVADSDNYTIDRIGYATATAPTGLTVTAGDTTAAVTFSPGDPGTSPVTGYEVSTDGGRTFTALSTTAGVNGTRTARLTGLTDGHTYAVQVRAVNGAGTSPASTTTSVTPSSEIVSPGAPTGVTATAGTQSLTVRWHVPADPGSPALTGYTVTVTDQATGARRVVHVGRVLEATVSGLTAGNAYTAAVTAVSPDRTGPSSKPSAPVTPTAPTAPPKPAPAPKPSVRMAALTVVGVRTGRIPVTCRVSTGRLSGCTVVFAARIGGHRVIIGAGARTSTQTARRAMVMVILNRHGRALAARVGGVPVTAAAAIRVPGRSRPLTVVHRTRVVTAVTVDPQAMHFAPASAELTPADRAELTGLRRQLHGVRAVVCAGYTDTVGDRSANRALGLARATAVCVYLTAGTHLKTVTVSFGETHPAATNQTVAGRAANRRALVALEY